MNVNYTTIVIQYSLLASVARYELVLGTRWFGYELVAGMSWSGYDLVLGSGTSWLGHELAGYEL